jgi:hypothetical protein
MAPGEGTPMSMVLLHHGTDAASANDILTHGIDAAKAALYNSTGEFWATTDPVAANWFAKANLANGPPARLCFEIPEAVLQALLSARPEVARTDGQGNYEFLPPSFPVLNQQMSGKRIVSVP